MERRRSFWGWGYEDRYPSDDARGAMAEQAMAVLGFPNLAPAPLPTRDALRLPEPKLAVPAGLRGFVSCETMDRALHTYGKSYVDIVRAFGGDFEAAPDAVAFPGDETAIASIFEWADRENLAVVPFGGGTSVVRGLEVEPPSRRNGVVSLDLKKLRRVLEIDRTSLLARIQAGALGPDLEAQLKDHGLTLRHFPQSFELSALGGWIATRAGGHFATLYTHIDELVSSMRLMTPRGLLETRTLPASGAGPDPNRFLMGSEGAFGVITEATMRVRQRPGFKASVTVHFPSFLQGVRACRAIAQASLYPSNCRLLDEREAKLNALCFEDEALLFLAFESSDHPVDVDLARALRLAESCGGRTPEPPRVSKETAGAGAEDPDTAEAWKRAFIEAPYLQSNLISHGVLADTFETSCTWSRFEALHGELVEKVRAAMKRVAGTGRLTCRFTHVYPDGPAPYYTFIAPARRGAELEQWAEIKAAASDVLLAQGATITHHHAVGRTHRPHFEREASPLFLDALRSAKRCLDPKGLMNPGVLFSIRE